MRYVCSAAVVAFSLLSGAAAQGQSLSITNYQLVSQQQVTRTQWDATYSATLVNTGGALASVTATLASGNVFSFRTVPGQTTLTFAPVPANGQVNSTGTFTILVDRTQPFSFSNLIWTFQTTAAPPVANAGPDQTAGVGSTVVLDGSLSTNPSGVGTLTYAWVFTTRPAGSHASLQNGTSVSPRFVADALGNYIIQLTVSNGTASSTDSVTVSTVNSAPVANAGPNQTVAVGSTVTLNGSGSTDVDGDSLTYAWTLLQVPTGSTAGLTGATTVSPTFIADKAGTYMAQLVVNDGHGNSANSTVTITTSNTPPVANAGPNQNVNVNSLVQLNGSGSTDVDGDSLTYQWSIHTLPPIVRRVEQPSGRQSDLHRRCSRHLCGAVDRQRWTCSTAPRRGDDHHQCYCRQPSMPDQIRPCRRHNRQLNGSGSDPEISASYLCWSLSKPNGSKASLSSTSIANPTLWPIAWHLRSSAHCERRLRSSVPSTVTIYHYEYATGRQRRTKSECDHGRDSESGWERFV